VAASIKYQKGSIVLEKCYSTLLGVAVQNTNNNAWSGSVQFSKATNGTMDYAEGQCPGETNQPHPYAKLWTVHEAKKTCGGSQGWIYQDNKDSLEDCKAACLATRRTTKEGLQFS